MLHFSSSTTDSYGDYLFAISIEIYHELNKVPLMYWNYIHRLL